MTLAIVVPCYNEADVLPVSAGRLLAVMRSMMADGSVSSDSYILFVNDGSSDDTWRIISSLHDSSPCFHGLNLACNAGHQNAIIAGMFTAAAVDCPPHCYFSHLHGGAKIDEGAVADSRCAVADAVITIDADLQDSLECIPEMVSGFRDGCDVVYGVRSSRKSDPFLKRFTAEAFYRFQSRLGLNTIYNHADFRLMSRRAVIELARYDERNIYLRGVVPMMGYAYKTVEEERLPRSSGKTKYPFPKMLSFAFDGISSFSIKPMYCIVALGGISVAIALVMAAYVIVSLCTGHAIAGWASLMLSIWLVGGMLMVSVGLVGLYVGKIYLEAKHRPRYRISDHIH